MRRLLLLAVLIFLFPTVYSVAFDESIFVNPFIFGQLKDDSGNPFNNYSLNEFSDGFFKTEDNGFSEVSTLDFMLLNNNRIILIKPNLQNYSSIKQYRLSTFSFIFNKPGYEESNISILFKLEP